MQKYYVYTDGSANNRADSRCGGWAYAILLEKEVVKLGYNAAPCQGVSSNMMELTAALEAIKSLIRLDAPRDTIIHCDSQYVVKGVTEWREGWERHGWRSSSGGMVSNRLLWKELHALHDRYSRMTDLTWKWVKGHAGNHWNEVVDVLADYKSSVVHKHRYALEIQHGRTTNP